MKIMTFNTQHCNNFLEGRIDFPCMAKVIREANADIVGLNEMRGEGADPYYTAQTETLQELSGMPYAHFAPAIHLPQGPYGNAFLSALPIVSVQNIPIPDPIGRKENSHYETRSLIKAKLEGGITLLVTHFGLNPDEQENAVKTVLDHITEEKCILMGDFNVPPDAPVLLSIRERMKDTAALFEEEKYSFPSDKPRVKIDYIFVSRDVTVCSADIPPIVASDHRPHVATISFDE